MPADSRSPLRPPSGPAPVGVAAGVAAAAAVAIGAFAGQLGLAIALIAVGAMLSLGAARLLGLPNTAVSTRTFLLGVASVAVVELTAGSAGNLRWLGTALAIGLMIAFLAELTRRDARPRLTESIAGAALVLALLATGAFFLTSVIEFRGDYAVYAAVAGVAIGLVVDALVHPRTADHEWSLPVGLVLAGLAGWVIGLLADRPWNIPMLSGLVACGLSYAVRSVLKGPVRPAEHAALGAASVLVAGIAPYALLWIFAR